jgi:hypothetical protein
MAMEMVVQSCSRLIIHDVHGIQGWVAAMSSSRRARGSLLGSHDASLHGHAPVDALVALPLIWCL